MPSTVGSEGGSEAALEPARGRAAPVRPVGAERVCRRRGREVCGGGVADAGASVVRNRQEIGVVEDRQEV